MVQPLATTTQNSRQLYEVGQALGEATSLDEVRGEVSWGLFILDNTAGLDYGANQLDCFDAEASSIGGGDTRPLGARIIVDAVLDQPTNHTSTRIVQQEKAEIIACFSEGISKSAGRWRARTWIADGLVKRSLEYGQFPDSGPIDNLLLINGVARRSKQLSVGQRLVLCRTFFKALIN